MIWTSTMGRVFALAGVMALACAAVGVWSYRTGHASGAAKVQASWDAERAAHARALIAAIEERDRATAAMAARTEALKREYKRETDRIAADRDRLLASLRERPERPAGGADLPEGSTAGVGCTGAGLSRDDAEFLVWYASEAARVQAALDVCVAAYKRVEEAVNGGD